MRSRSLRRLIFAGLVGVFVLVAGALGMNLYLNGEYLPKLLGQELRGLKLQYSFAWSLWPGRIHVEDLSLHGEEHGFGWHLSAGRAQVVADVGALLDKEVSLKRLVLTEATVTIRPRGEDLEPARSLAADGAGWAIVVPVVEVDGLRRLEVGPYTFEGDIDAEGSISVTADRVLTMGDTFIRVNGGAVKVDGHATLEGLRGEGTAGMDATPLSTARGSELLAGLRGTSTLKARVVGLPFLPDLPGLPVPLELVEGAGPVKTTVAMKGGAVQPGAELSWDVEEATLRASGFRFDGGFSLRAEVVEEEGEVRTRCALSFGDFRVGRDEDGAPPLASGEGMTLHLDAPNVDLGRANVFADDLQAALAKWPATLTFERVRLLGEERTVQWAASLDALEARVDLSAAAAPSRTLLLTRARGQGATIHLRPRLSKEQATAQLLRHLPPIPELASPPLKRGGAPKSLLARAALNPWSLRAEDVEVTGIREVWLESYRYEGAGRMEGAFLYEAGGRLSAGPLHFTLKDGSVHVAKWRAAKGVRGRLEAHVRPFDLQEAEGFGFFRALTARADLQGELDEVDFIRHFPHVPMPAELGGGQGPLDAKIALRDGVVQAGSEVKWETKAVQASTHGHRFIGPFSLAARWVDRDGEPRLKLEGRVSPYRLTKVGDDKALVSGRLATMRIDAPRFDLAHPSFEPLTQVQVVDGKVPDLRALNDYLPKDLPLKMEAGAGTFEGRVAFSHKGAAWADFGVGGKQAALVYDKLQVKGDWSCEVQLGNVNLTTGDADIRSAKVQLANMTLREGSRANDGWFGRIDVTRGTVRPGGEVLLSGELETTMRDGRPLIAFFASETDLLPGWARSLITLQALRATSHFRVGGDMVELDRLMARGQSLELRGRLRKKGVSQWGDMLVHARGQEVGVALRGSRVEFKLMGAAAWYRAQLLDPRW